MMDPVWDRAEIELRDINKVKRSNNKKENPLKETPFIAGSLFPARKNSLTLQWSLQRIPPHPTKRENMMDGERQNQLGFMLY